VGTANIGRSLLRSRSENAGAMLIVSALFRIRRDQRQNVYHCWNWGFVSQVDIGRGAIVASTGDSGVLSEWTTRLDIMEIVFLKVYFLKLLFPKLLFLKLLFLYLLFLSLLFQGLLFQGLFFRGLLFQGLLFQGLLFQGLLFQGLLFQDIRQL